jgi:hypothetical protein
MAEIKIGTSNIDIANVVAKQIIEAALERVKLKQGDLVPEAMAILNLTQSMVISNLLDMTGDSRNLVRGGRMVDMSALAVKDLLQRMQPRVGNG